MLDYLEKILNGIVDFLPTLLFAIVIYIAGAFLNKAILKLFAKGTERSRLDQTVRKFLSSVIKIVITALVLIIVLSVLGIPMTSIITVLGTAGVAVGLALKDSLSNVAGGVILLINQNIKVGNYVEIGAYSGTVEEISILFTKLSTPDKKDIYIPNGVAATSAITNYSSEGDRRVDLVFGISYENDHRKAVSAITEVAESHPLVLKDPAPFVRLGELGASSLNITVRVWTKNADYWEVYFDLIEQVKEKFDKENIVIPYNQIDVHIDK
ncbi:MAG: mechanosensitive ion channel [Ruminococcus sp.]|nr:mechanosensitive ion channel [Ruminococcus sp.]MCM1380779.1 mechanosensitive ion channel [Muribaculaceae bacterium]MCM1479334.1 mechanosensitive ion channel [Muribaculaceae bacterium]